MASPLSIDERNFPITLRNARERAGLTQRELGERAGVNFSQISRYEQGIALPRPGMLLKLADALGVTPEFLRKGEDLVHVDMVDPDGGRIPIAFPASEMDRIRHAAKASGRTVEEEILSMVLNGIRALEGELELAPGQLPPTKPKSKRNAKD
ncbi:helix-turn-helix domain-containing protein [Stenotrophomonas sp. STK17_22]|uniref:helix-turn-helix domain-containing protein n=1 Tax=Stenotrophomonas sp. STK17_22 TaxID=3455201 RepID=UPI003F7F2B7D